MVDYSGSNFSALVIRPFILVIAVNSRDFVSGEVAGEVTGEEVVV